jgi:hypothetical protein
VWLFKDPPNAPKAVRLAATIKTPRDNTLPVAILVCKRQKYVHKKQSSHRGWNSLFSFEHQARDNASGSAAKPEDGCRNCIQEIEVVFELFHQFIL